MTQAASSTHCTATDVLKIELERIITRGEHTERNKTLLSQGLGNLLQKSVEAAGAFYSDTFHTLIAGQVQRYFEQTLLKGWQNYAQKAYPDAKQRSDYYLNAWRLAPETTVSSLGLAAKMGAISAAGLILDSHLRMQTLDALNAEFTNLG